MAPTNFIFNDIVQYNMFCKNNMFYILFYILFSLSAHHVVGMWCVLCGGRMVHVAWWACWVCYLVGVLCGRHVGCVP
jgi:hypothetical protein